MFPGLPRPRHGRVQAGVPRRPRVSAQRGDGHPGGHRRVRRHGEVSGQSQPRMWSRDAILTSDWSVCATTGAAATPSAASCAPADRDLDSTVRWAREEHNKRLNKETNELCCHENLQSRVLFRPTCARTWTSVRRCPGCAPPASASTPSPATSAGELGLVEAGHVTSVPASHWSRCPPQFVLAPDGTACVDMRKEQCFMNVTEAGRCNIFSRGKYF